MGNLSHVATIITQGRTFLRELYVVLSLDTLHSLPYWRNG